MPEHVGLFLPLPERLARQYPADGKEGEDTSPPHVTLCYIGDVEEEKVAELETVLRRICTAIPPLELTLMPPRTFQNESGQTILHSGVDCPGLELVHDSIRTALERRGFNVEAYDQFRPHVTIEYIDPGERSRFDHLAPKGRWRADTVGFWVEDDHKDLPLGYRKTVRADAGLRDKIVEYFRENPNPSDDQVHELAESLGIEPHDFETQIYRLLTRCVQKADGSKRAVIACMLRAGRPELAQVVAYGGVRKPDDLLRSFNTLAKYNDGLWKSEKQGRFLWSWADGDDLLKPSNAAAAWAKSTGWYDRSDKRQRLLQFISLLGQYGKRDPTKTRFTGTFVLIDGTGVLATAGFKVKHVKKGEDSAFDPVPGSAKTRFVRDRKVVPPLNVDPAGDAAREQAKQLKANEPVIKAIESIPNWQSQDIFVDFHDILMAGGTLSPNMMRVVERNVPLPVMNVGDADDVATKMEACDRWIEKVLPIIMDGFDAEQGAKIKQHWTQYRAGTYADPNATTTPYMLYPFIILSKFFEDYLKFKFIRYFKGSRGVNWQVDYWAIKPYVTKAVPKLKRGKTPTKTEMVVVRTLLAFHDKLMGTSPDTFKRWFDKE